MIFQNNGEPDRIVEGKNAQKIYMPKALKKMIHQSGIAEEEWLKEGCP
jgi:hypothetical protein